MGFRPRPAHILVLGCLSYVLVGLLFLLLPISQEKPAHWLDHLFTATSAVSTTGLVTIDPGSTYNWFGEVILVLLFQLGGLGYMTATSFVILAANKKLNDSRISILKSAFSLPKSIGIIHFVRNLFVFTVVAEVIGAILLYPHFRSAGVEYPMWSAIFHSVSAFCTAGFSLFPTSFEGFKDNLSINLILSVLAYLGAIVFTDVWAKIRNPLRRLTFTTKTILVVTLALSLTGTLLIFLLEPSIQSFPAGERFLVAFFQTMTASTTLGFNTLPIAKLSLPVIMILYFLMFFGASPAGTGGGLKSTTLTALVAEIWSHLRGYQKTSLVGHEIPGHRIRAASMSATCYALVLGLGIFGLTLAMPSANFEWIIFEAISAIGTVCMSMGLTAELTGPAKGVSIALMYIGRIGVVTFGLSMVAPKLFQKPKKSDLAI